MLSPWIWVLFHVLIEGFSDRRDARARFLKLQIELLKDRLPGNRVILSPEERMRLLRTGEAVEHSIDDLMGIVSVKTYRRWLRERLQGKRPARVGRPRKITPSIRALVLRLARENHLWGMRRIVGELRKLGLAVCRSSVQRILHEEGILPDPERGLMRGVPTPWQTFLSMHLNCMVACDFLCKTIWTPVGKQTAYLLVFVHLGSRKVFLSPCIYHPTTDWVQQQARNVSMWLEEEALDMRFVIHDHDTKFTEAFDQLLRREGGGVIKTPYLSPIANAYAESWIGSFKRECLNHFICFSLKYLDYISQTYVRYYNELRPHQSMGNRPLKFEPEEKPPLVSTEPIGKVKCQRMLGGLLKHYYRDAA